MTPKGNNADGYIIERVSLGGSVKVTAVDTATLQEVSVVVPPNLSEMEAGELAIRKLRYMQEKNKGSA